MSDKIIFPAMKSLLDCLKEAALDNPNPPMHFVLRSGSDPVAADFDQYNDYCCQGMMYVRLLRRFPAGQNWPDADELAYDCAPAAWGANIEMGAFRCVPDKFDPAGWEASVQNIQNDQEAMVQAICCWVAQQEAENPCYSNFFIRDWLPFANLGGCTGGAMNVFAQYVAKSGCL